MWEVMGGTHAHAHAHAHDEMGGGLDDAVCTGLVDWDACWRYVLYERGIFGCARA